MSQDTMYMNVSAESSSVTIVGLDGSLAYSVQVSAGTRAGQGVQSTAQVAEGIEHVPKPNNLYIQTSRPLIYRSYKPLNVDTSLSNYQGPKGL